MTRDKGGARRPTKSELLETIPSIVGGLPGEAVSLVRGVLAGGDQDERVESLVVLMGLLGRAEGADRENVRFFAGVYALLYHSEGVEMFNQVGAAVAKRKKKR